MTKIKCGTFGNLPIPKEILKKMEADRAEAESKHETKAKTLPIQCVINCTTCKWEKSKEQAPCAYCGSIYGEYNQYEPYK